jgi:hypothetical protein
MTLLGTVSLTTYTDTSLTNGQIYYYRVCAYSSAGNGTMTDPLDAKPNGVSGADNALLYVGIGAIAIVAVAGAAMVMMRRRKP